MTELKMIIRHLRLVEYAHELGLVPVMVFCQASAEPRLRELMADPGHPLSALGEACQVADVFVDSVLAGVQDLTERYDVHGVVSCGERYVEPVAALAHLLGLAGTGWPAAKISRNKVFQRYALPDYSPRWRVIDEGARSRVADLDVDWGGPLVVKPASRWGSSGVRELRSAFDLAEVVNAYPHGESLLVEERVYGEEFSVESLVQDGALLWSGITQKQTNEDNAATFVEMAHTAPADNLLPAHVAELSRVNGEVMRRLDFRNGVAHAEYRLTGGGVMLMEVAFRVPGDGITTLWTLATGQSIDERIVDIAIGRKTSYPSPRRRARHVFLEHAEGILVDVRSAEAKVTWTVSEGRWPSIEPATADTPPRACAVLVSKAPGDEVGAIVSSDERSTSVMVDAPLDYDIDRVAEKACDGVEVVVAQQ